MKTTRKPREKRAKEAAPAAPLVAAAEVLPLPQGSSAVADIRAVVHADNAADTGGIKAADSAPATQALAAPDAIEAPEPGRDPRTQDPRLWRDDGWTARVIKNIDDEGWAVEMIQDGEAEPALTGPWTMGRDKKNPKPLDAFAFGTLVKTASEVLARHQQHQHAMLNKSFDVNTGAKRITVTLSIEPDEDNPSARLFAVDELDEELASVNVMPSFKLTRSSAAAWVENGFKPPRS